MQVTFTGDERGPNYNYASRRLHLHGSINPDVWNRFGVKVLPKMRSGSDLTIDIDLSADFDSTLGQQPSRTSGKPWPTLGFKTRSTSIKSDATSE